MFKISLKYLFFKIYGSKYRGVNRGINSVLENEGIWYEKFF